MTNRKKPEIFDQPPPEQAGEMFYDISFPSDLDSKYEILNEVLEKMKRAGWLRTDSDHLQVRLVLDEGLVNAVKHGNEEDQSKKVYLSIWREAGGWRCRIRDEGEGFHAENIPDPTDPENMFLDHGRGIAYMQAFFDEVQYFDGGRTLELYRRYDADHREEHDE